MKIGATTHDFKGSHLTPYGGLLPVATMLEKLRFQELIERNVTIKPLAISMPGFQFVMAMVLALSVTFESLCFPEWSESILHGTWTGRYKSLTPID